MRLCFVTPRYGQGIVGGAESLVRDFAERLVSAGHVMTVLTTCAQDHLTWANELPAGRSSLNGVTVRRFPITEPSDTHATARLYAPVEMGMTLAPRYEKQLMRRMGYSEPLLDAIDRLADDVDAYCFCPYLYATTVFGVAIRPEQSLILPCFHDEPFARVIMAQEAMRRAAGLIFNTDAERELAAQVIGALPPHRIVGPGIDPPGARDPEGFRAARGLRGDLIAYAGRREWGKNYHVLLEYAAAYGRILSPRDPVTLVVMGRGDFAVPASVGDLTCNLGFVDRSEMLDAISASVAVVNLSTNESLSYLLLEGWSCGVPAIVHSDCAVTRTHCEESGGGLWVRTPEGFAEALNRLRRDRGLRSRLGDSGRRYVAGRYSWPAAVARMEAAVTELVGRG